MTVEEAKLELPKISYLCLNLPLYHPLDLSKFDRSDLGPRIMGTLSEKSSTLDMFCVQCKQMSTFNHRFATPEDLGSNRETPLEHRVISCASPIIVRVYFHCSRLQSHHAGFFFQFLNGSMTKVGQIPSAYDLSAPELTKYRNTLGAEDLKELKKAVQAHTHGFSVGGFTYLRRIIETLVIGAEKEKGVDSGQSRFGDRIAALRGTLPDFLVDNKVIHGILSKGVHELSEEECGNHFRTLFGAIQLVLDEKIAKKERDAKILDIQKQLGQTTKDLSQSIEES